VAARGATPLTITAPGITTLSIELQKCYPHHHLLIVALYCNAECHYTEYIMALSMTKKLKTICNLTQHDNKKLNTLYNDPQHEQKSTQ